VTKKKKVLDPRIELLLAKQDKFRLQYEKEYTRLKRAFTRLESCRQSLLRIDRRLGQLSEVQPQEEGKS